VSRRRLTLALAGVLSLSPTLAVASSSSAASSPTLHAREWLVLEPDTGAIVSEHDPHAPVPVGSTTTLMTALLAIERLPLARTLAVPAATAATAATAAPDAADLVPGERLTVADLLRAVLLPGSRAAAEALAVGVAGTVPAFVAMMNARASALGLRDTHYADPAGVDDPSAHSSAADLARLADVLLTSSSFAAKVVAEPQAALTTATLAQTVVNGNGLVGRVPGVDGVQSGGSTAAGDVLVGDARRDGVHLESVVLGEPSVAARDADSIALLDEGFQRLHESVLVRAGAPLRRVALSDRAGEHIELVAGATVTQVVPVGARPTIALSGAPGTIDGPLKAGARAGTVEVRIAGQTVARVPLVTVAAVPKASLGNRLSTYLGETVTKILLAMLVACSLLLVALRRNAARKPPERARSAPGAPQRGTQNR
jgi:D-alanyl-D-alanine carboxypeptidase (penicillin-binding protein 5/6)